LVSLIVAFTSLFTVFLQTNIQVAQAVPAIVYADSANGNDTTGNGSSGSPYQTFHKAYTIAASGDTIDLTGTFTWSNASETGDAVGTGYTLAKNLTIRGQSRSTIVQADTSRNTADRMVFFIGRGSTVTLQKITIRYGKVVDAGQGGGITLYGEYCGTSGGCAGTTGVLTLDQVDVTQNNAASSANYDRAGGVMLQENANLSVTNSNIEDNDCVCKYYAAGGVYGGMQSATISISNSSVSNNTVNSNGGSSYPYDYTSVAGGLASQRFGKTTITNSTFYGNSTNSYGGAISLYYQDRGARLTNVTIVGNSATLGAGGILWNQLYTGTNYDLRLKNVLMANNTGVSGAGNDFYAKNATSGSAVIATYSIIEYSTNNVFSGTGIQTGDQALLNLDTGIAVNGDANGTRTLAILAGSVALNTGDSAAHGYTGNTITPPSTDQRSFARSGAYDIGAYENANGTDTTAPTVSSFTSAQSTPTSATSFTYTLTFSESVTDVVAGDFRNTGTATGCVFAPGTDSGSSRTVTVSSCSAGTVIPQFAVNGALDTATNTGPASAATATTTITRDVTAPTVSSFSSSTASGSYGAGATINITATVNKTIESGNTLTVTLDTGATVLLTAASAGTTLTGTYTVSSGHTSSDLTVSSFTIGTVADTAGNAMSSTAVPTGSNNIAGSKAIVIDTTSPTATWTPPSTPSTSRTLTYTLVFSESVTGIYDTDFSYTGTAAGCLFTPSASLGTSITVRVVCTSDGTVIARLAANSVSDSAANTGPASISSATSVLIDTTPAPTTTTTTVVPMTTIPPSTESTTTVAIGQSGISQITTTTTILQVPSASTVPRAVVPTTTTTSTIPKTTTTTTSPSTGTSPPMDSQTFSQASTQVGVGVVNGVSTEIKILRKDNKITARVAGILFTLGTFNVDGNPIDIDIAGNLRLSKDGSLFLSVVGLQPGSPTQVWMYSTPQLLATITADAVGTFEQSVKIDKHFPAGRHTIVVNGIDGGGKKVVIGLSVVVDEESLITRVASSRLVWVLLFGMLFLGLLIPSRRRQRKSA